MVQSNSADVVSFIVRSDRPNVWSVYEQGFKNSIAEFEDVASAEAYAWSLAETKLNWKIDIFDSSNELVATYNSEDDAMPRPMPTQLELEICTCVQVGVRVTHVLL